VSELSRKDWNDEAPTDVDKWLAIYEQDDNVFWETSCGHHMNIIDELIWRLNEARAVAWDEGFDAGERDVWMHEEKNDWGRVDTKCIPNPYREESK
jgi:hypothetical protein